MVAIPRNYVQACLPRFCCLGKFGRKTTESVQVSKIRSLNLNTSIQKQSYAKAQRKYQLISKLTTGISTGVAVTGTVLPLIMLAGGVTAISIPIIFGIALALSLACCFIGSWADKKEKEVIQKLMELNDTSGRLL